MKIVLFVKTFTHNSLSGHVFYWNILKSDVKSQNLALLKTCYPSISKSNGVPSEQIHAYAKNLLILYPQT